MDKDIYREIAYNNDYVVKFDLNGNILFSNDNYSKISGYSNEELINLKYKNLTKKTDKKLLKSVFQGQQWSGILENKNKDGSFFYIDTNIYPIKCEKNEIQQIVAFGKDVTKYVSMLKYDNLTKLKNREALRKDIKENKDYAIVIANLDNFSEINGFYGGYACDKIIIETANRLTNAFGEDIIYRLQGDEFAVLKPLPKVYDRNVCIDYIKNKLKSIFEEPFKIEEIDLPMTATFGMYIGNENFLRNANIAYKNSKNKNISFSVYKEKMFYKYADFSSNKKIAHKIKEAVKGNQVTPYYQPIIDNKTKELFKYEALARIVNQDDIMTPNLFIDVSKKIKYYNKISRDMIKKCFEELSKDSELRISINLTIDDIQNIKTFNFIIQELSKCKNRNITFELVESNGVDDYDLLNKFITTVRKFGAKIAIDDFGTGYSNFVYLTKIEPDFLKIDGSLIKKILNEKDFDLVKTIVDFTKMYNIKTIAEFVEDEEIFLLVRELGIDYSQGYFFGKPEPFV